MSLTAIALFTLLTQWKPTPLGSIDLFGQTGLDETKIRSAIPIKVGETIDVEKWPEQLAKMANDIEHAIGMKPTDIALTGFDEQGKFMLFVGVPGPTVKRINFRPDPAGEVRLPEQMVTLEKRFLDRLPVALQSGKTGEDRSKGYALSEDPESREIQLEVRKFAATHADLVQQVLRESKFREHRQAAAHILGYADRSPSQVRGLAEAATDSDEGVRNNAIRALGLIAEVDENARKSIPAETFIDMVRSGIWTDRNKGGFVLSVLTAGRDPVLLKKVRDEALDSLVEIARWSNPPHAANARTILGRLANLPEAKISELVAAGDLETILKSLRKDR
jgi:hypothetical protein